MADIHTHDPEVLRPFDPEEAEARRAFREFCTQTMDEAEELLKGDPADWWWTVSRFCIRLDKRLREEFNEGKVPERLQRLREYMRASVTGVLSYLKNEQTIRPDMLENAGTDTRDPVPDEWLRKAASDKRRSAEARIDGPEHERSVEIAMRTLEMINHMTEFLLLPDQRERTPITLRRMSIEELCAVPDNRVRLSTAGTELEVFSKEKNLWYSFPLPRSKRVAHKGGFPRVVLKVIAMRELEADLRTATWASRPAILEKIARVQRTLDRELPPNDLDVVAIYGDGVIAECKDMVAVQPDGKHIGVDTEGIEKVKPISLPEKSRPQLNEFGSAFNFDKLARERDTDINGGFVTDDGIVYWQETLRAIKDGHATVKSEQKGLYGTEVLFINRKADAELEAVREEMLEGEFMDVDKERLVKPRGMSRLMKFLAEGKIESFSMTPVNEKLNFDIHWLVLSRKFARKANGPELLARLYAIGKTIGQVRPGENDIYDVLERVHKENPFFNLNQGTLHDAGVARWLMGKLVMQMGNATRSLSGDKIDMQIPRAANDTKPYDVWVSGHGTGTLVIRRGDETTGEVEREETVPALDPTEHETRWAAFSDRCDARTKAYDLLPDDVKKSMRLAKRHIKISEAA